MDKFLAQRFTRGGEASLDSSTEAMNKYLLAEEEASPMAYATVPSAPTEAEAPDMSTAKSMLKRLATKGERGGKSSRPKGMGMELGDLTPAIPEIGAPPTEQEKLVKIATARSQFDALERAYKLKAAAAAKSGKGFSRPTFNALAFDQPTLEKPGPLMAKTFQFGGLVKAMKGMGKKGAPDPAQLMPPSAARGAEEAAVASPSIIKDEGGNWMVGGVKAPEDFVMPLYKAENLDNPEKAKSLNKWIDKKLTPYIKNKMATPSDPLRKLAEEEGILPFPMPSPLEATLIQDRAAMNRTVVKGVDQSAPVSTTPTGQAWENRADSAIEVGPYNEMIPRSLLNDPNQRPGQVLSAFGGDFAVQNPTAKVSGMNTGRGPSDLGFDHVIDVLQENMTTGRLSADSLRGLSMEDAVRLTHQYDQDMIKKMAEASIQSLKGVPVYKQYPEQGFRWMQLDKPGYFAAESDAMGHSVRGYEPPVGHPDWTPQSGNKGNLSYGNYGGWEAIKSGDVKVYSLADDLGKRYTTIETVPGTHPLGTTARGNDFPDQIRYGGVASSSGETIPEEKLQEIYALGKKMYFENPNAFAENRLLSGAPAPSPMDSFQKAADMVLGKRPPSINQIKGQVNGYIAEDAQPFVQDFLNSGNWSTVNNLNLARLKDLKDSPDLENFVNSNQLDNRRFLTEAEYNKYENDFLRNELKGQLGGFDPMAPSPVQPEGMAEGGEAKKDEDLPGMGEMSQRIPTEGENTVAGPSFPATRSQDQLRAYVEALNPRANIVVGDLGGMTRGFITSRKPDTINLSSRLTPGTREITTLHELEHSMDVKGGDILGRPEIGTMDNNYRAYHLLGKDWSPIRDTVKNMVDNKEKIEKFFGRPIDDAYFRKGSYNNLKKSNDTEALFSEQLATLSALEQATGKFLTQDPEMRNLFPNYQMMAVYDALTGPRQTRMDARDLPPHLPVPSYTYSKNPVERFLMKSLTGKNEYGTQRQPIPIKRAEGSPVAGEGELTQAEIDAASKPAFITPSSGKGRQAGNISKALASGRAYSAAAEGVTELPYDIAGLPMDIVMLARQALTGLEPTGQFGTSDYIKKKMTGLGVRPEPPADPTEKGFYTAGELLSNFTNPAAVTRGGVKVAQKTGQAVGEAAKTLEDLTVGEVQRARVRKAGKKAENIPDTAYDPLRERLEATGNLAYISRPPGGYFPTSRGMAEKTAEEINYTKATDLPEEFVSWLNTDEKKKTSFLGLGPKRESLGEKYNRYKDETGNKDYTFGVLSEIDKSLEPVLKKIMKMESGEKRDALFQMFNQKAKDFYSKQAGSIQDPLRADILSGKFKFDMDSEMGDTFPKTLIKNAAQGDLQALRLLEKNYDRMLGIRATVPFKYSERMPPPGVVKAQILENIKDNLDTIPDSQLLAYAGKKPLPGPDGVAEAATAVRLKLKENPNLFSTVLEPNINRTIFAEENFYSDLDMARYPDVYGNTATSALISPQGRQYTPEQLKNLESVPPGYFLPELQTAIDKSQPILDIPYRGMDFFGFSPFKLLGQATTLSVNDLENMSFPEFLKKAYTSTQEVKQFEKELKQVKSLLQEGKNPPAKIMLFGVKDFLPTVNDMRWVKVTNPDGVKSIAAGMNNSVGSYATTDTYGALGRGRRALESGEVEVYALYDKNHIPQVTVEYVTNKSSVPENLKGKIVQLTGNGPLTANASPEKFSEELVDFVNQLKLSPEQVPAGVKKIFENNFFKFDEGKFVRNEEEFKKLQETRKEVGLAKGGSVDKNMAFIKKHT